MAEKGVLEIEIQPLEKTKVTESSANTLRIVTEVLVTQAKPHQ